jgi:glutamate---cysteine ligase / carboxylate-amine ligase
VTEDFATHHFGEGEPYRLGVEEELFLADPRDGRQLNAGDAVLERVGDVPRGSIKGEVHACEIELITDVCASVDEAMGVLADLRAAVLATGTGLIGSGTHPTAEEGAAEINDEDRYRFISTLLGDAMVTPVAALHVHVGMPDPETAVRAFNGVRRHLPLLEALGANSPFRHGRDTGFASARELALRAWPRSGAPRAMAGYADFAAFADRLTRAAGVPDYTYHWLKLRPHPRLGTVEIRALDTQLSLKHTRGLVALVHCLARDAAEAAPEPDDDPAPEILEEASYRAGREGLGAELPDAAGRPRPVAEVLEAALARAEPWAAELHCTQALAALGDLVADGAGYGVQRAAADGEDLAPVLTTLLSRAGEPAA